MQTRFLKNQEIDKDRWNLAIDQSVNGLLYAYTWFLDVFCPDWAAVVYGDYSVVMPIPLKRKFGFEYVVQPTLAKKLGLFYNNGVSKEEVPVFFSELTSRYKYIRLNVNCTEEDFGIYNEFDTRVKKNHELDLGIDYNSLRKLYKRRSIRNLKKADQYGVLVRKDGDFNNMLQFWIENFKHSTNKEKVFFVGLMQKLKLAIPKHFPAHVYCAYNSLKETIAMGIVIESSKRLYFILNGSNEEGITSQAMYALTDKIIIDFSESGKVLDFTGSSIPSIAYFLESFGAIAKPYQYIEYNKLRFPLKYLVR